MTTCGLCGREIDNPLFITQHIHECPMVGENRDIQTITYGLILTMMDATAENKN